ncbi:MAG: hypothetical protein ACKVW3_05065 [Phycisphaerales bacterium]
MPMAGGGDSLQAIIELPLHQSPSKSPLELASPVLMQKGTP